jgi:hypothetical protein
VLALLRGGKSLPNTANALDSFGHTIDSSAQKEDADVKTLLRKVKAR